MAQGDRKISGAEVVSRLGEEQVRKAYRLLSLVDILRNSIIDDNYTPSDALSSSIVLTAKGQGIARKVSIESTSRNKTGHQKGGTARFPREAQLMCLLELGNGEPLVDLEEIDVEKVREAASEEVKSQKIRHPHLFGPSLYHKAADLFPDLLSELSHRQTMELLEGEEQGVFQSQEWLSGPFGIISVAEVRSNPPITRVPLQHCHDISCNAVHDTWLRTSRAAPINARRELIYDHISGGANAEEWDWSEAFKLTKHEDPRRFRDDIFANLLPLMGDGFDLGEKRLILRNLIESQRKEYADSLPHRKNIRSVPTYVERFSDAECLQEILWFADASIVSSIDNLVLSAPSEISIPSGEIRRCVLARPRGYGYFRTSAEVSRYGVRVSGLRNLASLRLDRAIRKSYESEGGQRDLEWKLRRFAGNDLQAKVNDALRRGELLVLIESILVDSRMKAQDVCEMVGLEVKHVDNLALPTLVAWKLGFDVPLRGDVFANFESESRNFHDAITAQADDFVIEVDETPLFGRQSGSQTERDIRGASSNYFVALENALREAVAFSTWALLVSQFEQDDPFRYNSDEALQLAAKIINERLPDADRIDPKKPTLGPLVEGLGVLGKILAERTSTRESDPLPGKYIPEAAEKSSLLSFPFRSRSLFDALDDDSKVRIQRTIVAVFGALKESCIVAERNNQLHYRPHSAQAGSLWRRVGQVLEAIRELDAAGLVPALSSLEEMKRGRWGKGVYVHTVQNRRRVELYSPSSVFAGPLPSLREDQLIIPLARLKIDGSPLRFSLRTESSFSKMWQGVPSRRRRSVDEGSIVGGLGIGEGARGL